MSQEFSFPERVDIWVPLGPLSNQELYQIRANHALYALARLKPDVTIEQARADMKNVAAALEKQYPDSNQGNSATVIPLSEIYVGGIRQTLYVLLIAVGFVLLIACANVACLALARGAARLKEMAVRSALGAGPWRIVRQLLSESLLLAIAGGGLGVSISYLGVPLILSISPEGAIPRATEINLDQSVLLFAAAISILTGVVSGLAPALHVSRPDLQETLKETARSVTGRQGWLRSGLVVIEIALTLVLLIGLGLLVRSYLRLQQVNLGFVVENRFSFKIWLPTLYMNFTVRTQLAHEHLIASVRRQVQEVDPNKPIFDINTLEEIRAESSASDRLNLTLLGVFAAVALVLALVGIYGVVSWTVTQRTHEIGVRMALGARVGDVLRLVVGQGMKVVIAGVGLGLAGAFALTRLMKALLFEVSATDPDTFVFITLLLVGVALLACFIPARRAMKVDPTVALRSE